MEPMLDKLSTTGQQDEQRIKQQDERPLENWQERPSPYSRPQSSTTAKQSEQDEVLVRAECHRSDSTHRPRAGESPSGVPGLELWATETELSGLGAR
jgi:hypothetical protein